MFYLKQASSFRQGPTGQVFALLKHTTSFNNVVGSVNKEAKDGVDLRTAYVVDLRTAMRIKKLWLPLDWCIVMSNREKQAILDFTELLLGTR